MKFIACAFEKSQHAYTYIYTHKHLIYIYTHIILYIKWFFKCYLNKMFEYLEGKSFKCLSMTLKTSIKVGNFQIIIQFSWNLNISI